MKIKISKGVIILAIFLIVSGVFGLTLIANPKSQIDGLGGDALAIIAYALGLAFSFISLAGGIFLLGAKPWARRLAVFVCMFSIFNSALSIYCITHSLKKNGTLETVFEQRKQDIMKQVKPEFQKAALDKVEQDKITSVKSIPVIFTLWFIFIVLPLNLGIIYFLNRPKIKEQFEPIRDQSKEAAPLA